MGNSASYYQPVSKKFWQTPIKVGGKIPNVEFKIRVRNESEEENPFEWKNVTSEELFKGKRVVLFALPGAFTPTCSSKHVPGYVEASDEIKSLGIDDIFCLSANDAFVMRQWGIKQGLEEEKVPGEITFKKVKFLPDGNLFFTRGMGMACMFTNLGFGERSWRYSVVINDLKVEKIFIEGGGKVKQNPDSDPYEVSDAKTMLDYLKSKKEEDEKKEKPKVEEKAATPEVEKAEEAKGEEPKATEETPVKEEEPKAEEEAPAKEEPKPAEEAPAKEEPEAAEEAPTKEEAPKAAEEAPATEEEPKATEEKAEEEQKDEK